MGQLKISDIGEGLGSFLSRAVAPSTPEFNQGFSSSERMTREELLAVATLPDYLLGKLARLASSGRNIPQMLQAEEAAVVRVRIGATLAGLLVQGTAEENSTLETAEQLFATYAEWAEKNPIAAAGAAEGAILAYSGAAGALATVETGPGAVAGGTATAGVVGVLAAPSVITYAGLSYFDATDALDSDVLESLSFQDEKCVALSVGMVSIAQCKALQMYDRVGGIADVLASDISESVDKFVQSDRT